MKRVVSVVRTVMSHIAGFINYWSKGKIKPSHITTISLLGHIPVAWALVTCRPLLAAALLAFFGILDALDGALARVQGSASTTGMFFDAVSDRIKEVIVYSALAVYAAKHFESEMLWMIVALCGSALLVSYVKAKGEMAVAAKQKDTQKLNRLFSVGFASYELRMVVIIVGLIFGVLELFIPLLIAANLLTAALRFIVISKVLYNQDLQSKQKKSHEN